MWINSMPASIVCARRNDLNPVISFIRHLIFLWSCSIRLFRYLLCLMVMVSSSGLPALSVVSAAVLAPLLSYPRNVDTALSEVWVFELFRTYTATGTVATPAIVNTHDIIKHRRPHYFPAGIALAVDAFHFHRVEDAFHTGIVITAAPRAHAATQIMTFQQCLIIR